MTDYRIWPATDGPASSVTDGQQLNLAHEVRLASQAWVTALHFWRGTETIAGTITAQLFTVDGAGTGTPVPGTEVTFTLSGTGWQTTTLGTAVELSAAIRYKVALHVPGEFSVTSDYWTSGPGASGIVNGILTAYSDTDAVDAQGTFSTGAASNYPAGNGNGNNYWIDLTVTDVEPVTEVRVVLDLAVETNTAHAVTVARVVPLDLAVETDTAAAVSAAKRVVLDLATETDTAHALTINRVVPLALAVETDTAFPIGIAGTLLVPGVHAASSSVAGLSASSAVSGLEAR